MHRKKKNIQEATMSKGKQESLFWGFILLVIGILFMLRNFGIRIDIWHIFGTYWPLILVAIGLKNIIYYISMKNRNE